LEILVIGAGFIGKHLIEIALQLGYRVRVIDRNEMPVQFANRVMWFKGDFCNKNLLNISLEGVDVTYLLASSTVPGDRHIQPNQEIAQNVTQTLSLLDLCVQKKVKRIVFASSSAVYGIQAENPIKESASVWPISYYGIHKLVVERLLWLSQHENGPTARIARISNPYGPGQNINGRQGFIAIAIGAMLQNRELIVRGEGEMIRDFIFIKDLARALVTFGMVDEAPLVLNIGSGKGCSLSEVLRFITSITKQSFRIQSQPARSVDIQKSVLDVSLLHKTLDFKLKYSLQEGLLETLNGAKVL
jgi:UDP-glucose 4-epimerase